MGNKPTPAYPELLDSQDWRLIRGVQPWTSKRDATMCLPEEKDDCDNCGQSHGQHAALHEMLHEQISPIETNVISPNTNAVKAAEEIRIYERMSRLGMHDMDMTIARCEMDGIPHHDPVVQLLYYNTGPLIEYKDELLRLASGGMDGLIRMVRKIEHLYPEGWSYDHQHHHTLPKRSESNDALWGRMTIDRPPLTLRVGEGRNSKMSLDSGVVPRNWHRALTDQRVFVRRAHRVRSTLGSLLIDASGSMHWNEYYLASILERVPHATIATYRGVLQQGILRIIAMNGMRISRKLPIFPNIRAGNEIDGPALDWLGRQQPGRVWLSDGAVCAYDPTVNGETFSLNLQRDARKKMARYRIRRVEDAEMLLHLIKEGVL